MEQQPTVSTYETVCESALMDSQIFPISCLLRRLPSRDPRPPSLGVRLSDLHHLAGLCRARHRSHTASTSNIQKPYCKIVQGVQAVRDHQLAGR